MAVDRAFDSEPLEPRVRRTAVALGVLAILTGACTFLGWVLDVPRLADWLGSGVAMQPNTAIALVAAGSAIVVLAFGERGPAAAFGAVAGLIGAATLFEHLSGISLGIDGLLVIREWGSATTVAPGRMGLPSSTCLSILGASLVCLAVVPHGRRIANAGGLLIAAIALVPFVGFLYGATLLYLAPRLTAVAFSTSLAYLAIGLALFISTTSPSTRALIVGRGTVAGLARWLVPIVVLLPILIGWLRVQIDAAGAYDEITGSAIRSVAEVALLVGVLWIALGLARRHEEELARTREELERRRRELSAFLETATVGVHSVDPDGVILWANDAELRTLGYAHEAYVGRHISEFHVDPRLAADMLARLRRNERIVGLEAQLRCADGSARTVLIDSSAYVENGRFLHSQSFMRDITERKQVEVSAARLASIVEFSHDAMVSKTLDGVIRSWNRGAESMFGYSEEEAVGRHITLIIPEDRLGEEVEVLAKLRRGEAIEHYETVRRRKDGQLIDISLTVSPIRDSTGRVVGASKVARDVTERKRVDAALAAHKEALERHRAELEQRVWERSQELVAAHERLRLADRMAAVGTLASGLAHDMKNVLLPLGLRLDTVLASPGLSNEASTELANIYGLLQHLRAMASNLSLFSKDPAQEGSEGRTELAPWYAQVRGFIDALGGPAVVIRWDIPGDLPPVAIAPHRLTQAVLNLVHNGRDAILQKRTALAGSAATGRITVAARAAGKDRVELCVTDDGSGMSEEVRLRCLEPFFTTKDRGTTPGAAGGTGMGLSLAHAIVERVGGELDIESKLGTGTTITLRLRVAPLEVVPVTVTAADAPLASVARRG